MYGMLSTFQGWCPWCGGHMGWGGWTMMFGWLLILVLVIVAVWAIAQGKWPGGERRRGGWGRGEDRAEAVLRERYARGEIDEETYRRMLAELRRN